MSIPPVENVAISKRPVDPDRCRGCKVDGTFTASTHHDTTWDAPTIRDHGELSRDIQDGRFHLDLTERGRVTATSTPDGTNKEFFNEDGGRRDGFESSIYDAYYADVEETLDFTVRGQMVLDLDGSAYEPGVTIS
ncbi:MAG: hypothetical protein ACK5LO_17445 [Leucobacter sp.]